MAPAALSQDVVRTADCIWKKSDAREIKIGHQISHGAHRKSTRDSSWTVARFPCRHEGSWLDMYLGWYSDRGRVR